MNGSVTFNYPTGGEFLYAGPTFSQRTETATNSSTGIYTYSAGVITRPDGSKLTVNSGGTEIKNSAGVSFAKTVLTYTNDPSGSPQVQSVTTYDDTNTPTKVDFDYDQYRNVVNRRSMDGRSRVPGRCAEELTSLIWAISNTWMRTSETG